MKKLKFLKFKDDESNDISIVLNDVLYVVSLHDRSIVSIKKKYGWIAIGIVSGGHFADIYTDENTFYNIKRDLNLL